MTPLEAELLLKELNVIEASMLRAEDKRGKSKGKIMHEARMRIRDLADRIHYARSIKK